MVCSHIGVWVGQIGLVREVRFCLFTAHEDQLYKVALKLQSSD